VLYGGASNARFSREGDIGADPFDSFFITASKCQGNLYDIRGTAAMLYYGPGVRAMMQPGSTESSVLREVAKMAASGAAQGVLRISASFPPGTQLSLVDAGMLEDPGQLIRSRAGQSPLLLASCALSSSPLYISFHNPGSRPVEGYSSLSRAFRDADTFRKTVSGKVQVETPDPFLNPLGGVYASAEDAIWQAPGYLHGAIGWRVPLTGWRGSYVADVLGAHDRARAHFNGYAASQVTGVPVTLAPLQDETSNLARAAKIWGTPMYSNGYICRNPNRNDQMHHYDMNLCYIDELLWHLNWTGDTAYARQIFPVIKRHLAWEKNAFDPQDEGLYDAHCAIWASDALQYNGGAVTHTSAYNYRANKMAAAIARKLGEDATSYQQEADKILGALNDVLWLRQKGWWAEFKDRMGYRKTHESAALWTIYHAIDSDAGDAFQTYQATRYVDTQLPHIPVLARGLKDEGNHVVATSRWVPYIWSINNVAFAEEMHTALAYWQAGRAEEAFKIYKGTILDAMYLGSGPGNITQISFYDAARGETYRDFADPVAMGSRAMVQGLFGILPDLMNGVLRIRPGFPAGWDHASIRTRNLFYSFRRNGNADTYVVNPSLAVPAALILELTAPRDQINKVLVNGAVARFEVITTAVGHPVIRIHAGMAPKYQIEVEWSGSVVQTIPAEHRLVRGQPGRVMFQERPLELFDPQGVFEKPQIASSQISGMVSGIYGHRTCFVRFSQGVLTWWQPVHIEVIPGVELLSDGLGDQLAFTLLNNAQESISGRLMLNDIHSGWSQQVLLEPGRKASFRVAAPRAVPGTNRIWLMTEEDTLQFEAINWNIPQRTDISFRMLPLKPYLNDKLSKIFAYGKYLTPRYPYTTLQVPTQGVGNWCHPLDLPVIDDAGLRRAAGVKNVFSGPCQIPFATPSDSSERNVMFCSLWDNYPNQITVPLSGKASHAYFLVAGSTNHMQAYMVNGTITVTYRDGSKEVLPLILPDNWLPVEQDLYMDEAAFKVESPRPFRVSLKTGRISKTLVRDQGRGRSAEPNMIDGGAATVIDMPLNPGKEMVSMELKAIASEVVLGIMSVTFTP